MAIASCVMILAVLDNKLGCGIRVLGGQDAHPTRIVWNASARNRQAIAQGAVAKPIAQSTCSLGAIANYTDTKTLAIAQSARFANALCTR